MMGRFLSRIIGHKSETPGGLKVPIPPAKANPDDIERELREVVEIVARLGFNVDARTAGFIERRKQDVPGHPGRRRGDRT